MIAECFTILTTERLLQDRVRLGQVTSRVGQKTRRHFSIRKFERGTGLLLWPPQQRHHRQDRRRAAEHFE